MSSALSRLSAASRLADRQADLKKEEADDINNIYSDYVTYTQIGDGEYGTMNQENFYRQHGLKFEHTRLDDTGKEITVYPGGMQAEDYDALEPYKNGVMSEADPAKHKFYFIKNMDDALQLMDSSSSVVSYNDVETGENKRGVPVGVLIDRDTNQIHALNKTDKGIFPFNKFRNNDPTTPILFTNAEGAYKTFNLALSKNMEAGPNAEELTDVRARLQLAELADKDGDGKVDFKNVFKGMDTDVENNLLTPGEALELNNELWTPLQEAIDAKQDEEAYNKLTDGDTLFDRVPAREATFGQVNKESIVASGDERKLPIGTSNTAQAKYGVSLEGASEIITAFESGSPLETSQLDIDILQNGIFPRAYGGDLNYNAYSNVNAGMSAPDITALNQEIKELEGKDPNEIIAGPRSRNLITGTSSTITGAQTPTTDTTVGAKLAKLRGEKVIAEKAAYDYAIYVKDKILEDDATLQRVGFNEPRAKITKNIEDTKDKLNNTKISNTVKESLTEELEGYQSELQQLDSRYPVLAAKFKLPENSTTVEEIPSLQLPTNEDGSLKSDAEVFKYVVDNEAQIRELLTGDTYNKIAAGLVKYGVTGTDPNLNKLPYYDPEIDLSLFEAVLGVTVQSSDQTTFDLALKQNFNLAFAGEPFISPSEKFDINKGVAEFNLDYIETIRSNSALLRQQGMEYAAEKNDEFQVYIDGDKSIDLYKNFDNISKTQIQSAYTANAGQAVKNYRGLQNKIQSTGSIYGGQTKVVLKNNSYQFDPPLSIGAKNALKYATGDILLSLAVRHGKTEKGGLFGTRFLSGRNKIDNTAIGSVMHTAKAVAKLDKNGDPYIEKFTFTDPTGTQYTSVLTAATFREAFPDPEMRQTVLALIPEVIGSAGLYVE